MYVTGLIGLILKQDWIQGGTTGFGMSVGQFSKSRNKRIRICVNRGDGIHITGESGADPWCVSSVSSPVGRRTPPGMSEFDGEPTTVSPWEPSEAGTMSTNPGPPQKRTASKCI